MIFKELLSGISATKVLDVGCGTGQFIEILLQSLGSFGSVTGMDVNESALQEAGTKFNGNDFKFIKASSLLIPFEDDLFDLVSISKALHHVEDDRKTLIEMKRVLKQGGFFLINEMIRDGLSASQQSHLHYHHLRAEIDQLLGVNHNRTYLRRDLLDLIHSLGLEDLTIAEFDPEASAYKDPANVDEYIAKMKGWLDDLAGRPEQAEFNRRIEALSDQLRENGIASPTQIFAIGILKN